MTSVVRHVILDHRGLDYRGSSAPIYGFHPPTSLICLKTACTSCCGRLLSFYCNPGQLATLTATFTLTFIHFLSLRCFAKWLCVMFTFPQWSVSASHASHHSMHPCAGLLYCLSSVLLSVGSFRLLERYGPHGFFVLPQKSYLTSGSLADQVCFPLTPKDTEDMELFAQHTCEYCLRFFCVSELLWVLSEYWWYWVDCTEWCTEWTVLSGVLSGLYTCVHFMTHGAVHSLLCRFEWIQQHHQHSADDWIGGLFECSVLDWCVFYVVVGFFSFTFETGWMESILLYNRIRIG
jgi:hypothetical protein